ncbi:MAG: Gfo/Idh/MocA family oxidoreductase [Desulfomonile tiedjei]|nr:Gfo/Idh/MocA family oxidoreductase [Desulfomonile tiedjei]
MDRRSIGLIGAGHVVRTRYLPLHSKRDDCRVVAICSRNVQTAKELAAAYHVESVYSHYKYVLERADIDTIMICTPPSVHTEIALAAMQSHKNILLEKPICSDYSDTHSLLQQAASYSHTFYPVFNNQFRAENHWLIESVNRGTVGKPRLVSFEWFRTDPFLSKAWLHSASESGGGVLMDFGVHLLQMALLLLPTRERFAAWCVNLDHGLPNSTVEDTSAAIVTVDDNVIVTIRAGWDMRMSTKARVRLEVFGTESHILSTDYTGPKADPLERLMDDFFSHVEAGTSPDLAIADDTMKLVDALYRSAQTGLRVVDGFSRADYTGEA